MENDGDIHPRRRARQGDLSRTADRGSHQWHRQHPCTILDSAMATAVASRLDENTRYTTVEFKISFIRRLEPGLTVNVVGSVLNCGRRLATAEAAIQDASGRLMAHGTTTCIIL
ncbi:PaaI family thioesterase [Sphingobium sp. HBC34]|uniref:PaaI family thioesterase n=1 Tax=Sphingobium cyanobacteriorum TaxID=3063954 RepID=A0ABT8ZQH2_9SPHN|nr:PaaI family thioesterase [Sphingobium sp. HBC34]MDO7836452.1 PaaI family thioesterase [Sphingobium sp. HBC34]